MNRQHVKHRIRETSVLSLKQVEGLSKRQLEVYNKVLEFSLIGDGLTDRETASELGYPDPNKVRPRRHELWQNGFIEEAGKRKCRVSGRMALLWRAKDVQPLFRRESANTLTQLRFIPNGDWQKIARVLEGKGFTYIGSMTWRKPSA